MNIAIVVSAGIVVVLATIIVLVAARREPDGEHLRTLTRYVDSVSLLSVFVMLFALYAAIAQLCQFIVNENHRSGSSSIIDRAGGSFTGGSQTSIDGFLRQAEGISRANDMIWRGFVQAVLVAIAAAVVWSFHARQRRALRTSDGFDASSGARVDLAFRYAVCFVAAFLVLMALAFGTYGLFRIAAPGVASSGGGSTEQQRGIAQALSLLSLAVGAVVIFRAHWSNTMHPASRDSAPTPDVVMS